MSPALRWTLRRRRGVTAAECGVVYSITLLLTMGTLIAGMGVYRYQQISLLAHECARWAAVHGTTYQSEQNKSAPTSDDLYTNVIAPNMVLLDSTQLTYTLSTSSNMATVTISYNWVPEGLFSPITLSSTAVAPITY
jgi:hypothetical protein